MSFFKGLYGICLITVTPKHPLLTSEGNHPSAATGAQTDSYSFALQFVFVLKQSPFRVFQSPKTSGVIGSY